MLRHRKSSSDTPGADTILELFHAGSEVLPIHVIRSPHRHKTIAISVTGQEIVVRAPVGTPKAEIQQLLKDRRAWINQCRARLAERPAPSPDPSLSAIWYLGQRLQVEFRDWELPKWDFRLAADVLKISRPAACSSDADAHAAIRDWYRQQAKHHLPVRLWQLANLHRLLPNSVRIKEQKSRWGSCSARGNINLNWRLMLAPTTVSDYVLVHELCHLRELNHSARFWSLVAQVMPDYQTHRQWLKDHADRLHW